jgi:DNA-binding MarR family transcriptional regulator
VETPRTPDFDLDAFLPYLLNQAAESASRAFEATYRSAYGMTRTQWRVLANLGRFGALSARDICRISHVEKTKVSRAVAALEAGGLVARRPSPTDRRAEILSLTGRGQAVFADLGHQATAFDRALRARLGPQGGEALDRMLRGLIAGPAPAEPPDPAPQDARSTPRSI